MRGAAIFGMAAIVGVGILAGCSLPAPYQTYSPGSMPGTAASQAAATPAPVPTVVYGATTTTADMVPDNVEEPAPTQLPVAVAPIAIANAIAPLPGAGGIAICYNRLWNKPETVKAAAVQACGANSSPQVTSQRLDIDACPLLTPTKAVFSCGTASNR